MRSLTGFSLASVILLGTLPAVGQSTRVLIPIVATNTPGVLGSQWTSETVALNTSDLPINVNYSHRCDTLCIPGAVLHESVLEDLSTTARSAVPAAFIYVPNESVDAIEFGLRVRDVSRQSDSWGTEVPVVCEDRAFQRPFDLLNVPLPSRFRQTLRVYGFDKTGGSVRVQYYDTAGRMLKEFLLPLLPPRSNDIFTPAYLQFDQFAQVPELAGVERIRVRISPTDASQRLWAMISVTNNVTQELTMITPQ